jgi:hypothetical protein
LGSKSGRCVGLTTVPSSCADCYEIWEPQPAGTLWACLGMYRDCLTLSLLKLTDFPSLTFVGLCIVIYFCSKTNQMHNISHLFYFGTTLYIFRTVFPSIIRSIGLYVHHQVHSCAIQVMWLLATGNEMELVPASKHPQNLYVIHLMVYVQS